jgi:hypothetical protein
MWQYLHPLFQYLFSFVIVRSERERLLGYIQPDVSFFPNYYFVKQTASSLVPTLSGHVKSHRESHRLIDGTSRSPYIESCFDPSTPHENEITHVPNH